MKSIPFEEFDSLFTSFKREAIHLEMRDAYGTAVELPHLAKWEAGEPDDVEWLQAGSTGCAPTRQLARHSAGRASCPSRSPSTRSGCSRTLISSRGRRRHPVGAAAAGIHGRFARQRLLAVRHELVCSSYSRATAWSWTSSRPPTGGHRAVPHRLRAGTELSIPNSDYRPN